MKKLAALLACVLALSLGLTACGGSSASGSTTSAAATSGEKQLVVQLGPDPETLDPALNSAIDGANMILFAFDTLLGVDEDLNVATHRVIEIDAENQHFYTKGDANNAPDGAPVYFKNLIGRPVFTIPYLGYFSNWITTPPGMYVAIAAAGVFIILLFLPDVLKKADEADKRAAEKKKQKEQVP